MHKLCFIIFNIFVGASRKTAHAILVPHYVHIYIIIFFVCITLCYVIATLAHVYICMDICGNKLLTYLLTYLLMNVNKTTIAGREMPQIHGNWALGDKFLQFCMMLHMGIRYSKTTANKVG